MYKLRSGLNDQERIHVVPNEQTRITKNAPNENANTNFRSTGFIFFQQNIVTRHNELMIREFAFRLPPSKSSKSALYALVPTLETIQI